MDAIVMLYRAIGPVREGIDNLNATFVSVIATMNDQENHALENAIAELPRRLPIGTEFKKLQGDGEPYYCYDWKFDRQERFCLYYEFPPHRKRVPVSEIQAALCYYLEEAIFDRKTYKRLCPIASSGGPCGFAVIGRIMEKLFHARYEPRIGFRNRA